ncbi:alpha/beta hydrolase family protein [Streptomyces sp. NPDC052396]|uniref:alpha/beta hydrolase family protein n=1 Tax=Streptomyces sp. NPDC052396 TaxID=3365689 RepID=UPI0037CDECFF
MTRLRRTATATAVLALVLPLPIAGVASAAPRPAPVASTSTATHLALPRPTGTHAVGREVLHLVDRNRQDPWVPSAGPRQLMVSMYYPARPHSGGPAPYMTTAEARALLTKVPQATLPPEVLSHTRTWARTNARPEHGRFPLVALSPGFTMQRATLTGLAEELASHGYVVSLVDHTYENLGETFPDGTTLPCAICDKRPAGGIEVIPRSRAKDVSFVLDELTGRHPAWRHAHLIDKKHIGMAGHSLGGASSAATMAADQRVRAGVNLDGSFDGAVPASGLGGRPFLMMGHPLPGGVNDPSWTEGWSRLDGWKRWLTVAGTVHPSFTDLGVIAEQAGIPLTGASISGPRADRITRAYVTAFFDQHLKGVREPLFNGPSPEYPEVTFHGP